MKTISDFVAEGHSAFPSKTHCYESAGMTLRDYFAAKAMQAGISTLKSGEDFDEEEFAKTSYNVADAMLAERAK